jgi:signal transduction histidine kinase
MLLWSSFLIIAVVLIYFMDRVVQLRVQREVEQQNLQVKEAVNQGFYNFAAAMSLAQSHLSADTFLYDNPNEIPHGVEHIIIADEFGNVKDSTLRELVDQNIPVPERAESVAGEDPVEGELPIHGGVIKTYDFPIRTTKGLHWIIIVMQQSSIISKIDDASVSLSAETQKWAQIRFAASAGLLVLALAVAMYIGGRFTRPVKDLADAARKVAAGNLNFQVPVDRRDEVGQLASTFNEMIVELKSKHELEDKLNQSERAAVIGRLTQGVAHEIRNPLNVLNLSIDHVRTKFAPDNADKKSLFFGILASIKDEIARLNRMVTDLLNYGRPAQLELTPIDMTGLVEETISFIRPQANDQGVTIELEKDGAADLILGDAERLKSCMSNIAINAMQSMPDGGRLQARVHRQNGFVEVSISDTGVGISEEALGKIFEPYFSTKKAGFGIGLAVTKKIVEEHRGSVEVRSRLGEGTTFTIKLPVAGEETERST